MFIEILKHTPIWVFGLFFVLLALGFTQSKARTVDKYKVIILPCVMTGLSFYGVVSAFGPVYAGLLAWFIGMAVAVWLGWKFAIPKGVAYFEKSRSFLIPGSWMPLILMMAIFFTKYAVGVVLALQLNITKDFEFIVVVSCLYGCFSGLFFSRLLVIRRAINQEV